MYRRWWFVVGIVLLLGTSVVVGCDDGETDGEPSGGSSPAGGSGGSTSSSGGAGAGGSTNTGGNTSTGGNTASGGDGGAGGSVAFELTSSAFDDGGAIPVKHTCDGDNLSPELSWTAGPDGTLSYAVILADVFFDPEYLHSAIWNIPSSTLALPEGVENAYEPANVPGALQCDAWDGTIGYSGPCPPSEHTYEFRLYAIDEASLSGVDHTSSVDDVLAAIETHKLDEATLSGVYAP